jgi:hypothetical protein
MNPLFLYLYQLLASLQAPYAILLIDSYKNIPGKIFSTNHSDMDEKNSQTALDSISADDVVAFITWIKRLHEVAETGDATRLEEPKASFPYVWREKYDALCNSPPISWNGDERFASIKAIYELIIATESGLVDPPRHEQIDPPAKHPRPPKKSCYYLPLILKHRSRWI